MSKDEQDPSLPLLGGRRSISKASKAVNEEKDNYHSIDNNQEGETESRLSVVQDFISTLHQQSKVLQETASLPCSVFYSGCKQLDEIVYTASISSLPEDLRLQLSDSVCNFIILLLKGICKEEDPLLSRRAHAHKYSFDLLHDAWNHYIQFFQHDDLQLRKQLKGEVCDQFLCCLESLKTEEPVKILRLQSIMHKFYLFLECTDQFSQVLSTSKLVDTLKTFIIAGAASRTVRLLAMFILSLYTLNDDPHLLSLEEEDIELLIQMSPTALPFSTLQKLKFVCAICGFEVNKGYLTSESVIQFVSSVFSSEEFTTEQEVATVILSSLFTTDEICSESEFAIDKAMQPMEVVTSSVLNDIALHVQEAKDNGSSDEERGLRICLALQQMQTAISSDSTTSVAKAVSSVPYAVNVLCIYLKLHLDHIGALDCPASYCHEIVLLVGNILVNLTSEIESTWQVVIESGLANVLIGSLSSFSIHPGVSDSEALLSRINSTLMLLHNCFSEIARYCILDKKAKKLMKSLQPYIKSIHKSICFNAEGLLLHLGQFLIKEDRKSLILSHSMICELVQSLRQSISKPEELTVVSCDISVSAIETIGWLRDASIVDDNIILLLQNGVLEFLLSLLTVAKEEVIDSSLHLLWSLFLHKDVRKSEEFQGKIVGFTSTLKSITCCTELRSLVLTALHMNSVSDIQELLNYAHGCHDHGNYIECERVCQRVLACNDLDVTHMNLATLLLGKAVFKLYQEENKLYLAYKESFSKRELHMWEESQSLKVKSVIWCYNKADALHDDELAMQFDMAMMECICGKNDLHQLSRCMLCLKGGQKLKRSHIIPKSVLDNFRKAVKQYKGNKLFQLSSALKSSQFESKYFSDKTLTRYMLCEQCEALLNVGGEQPFYKDFFKKIYDPLNPECLTITHALSYKEWLYHFCLGYIFRGIAAFIGIPDVTNAVEFYTLFKLCRQYLLNKELEPKLLPKVHIFINPTSPPLEYRQHWTQEVLVGPAAFYFADRTLLDGVVSHYPEVHFFIAKVGIICILVRFSPSEGFELPMTSLIDPSGGTFVVPAEHERSVHLPLGIKELYSSCSQDERKRIQESMFRNDKFAPIPIDEGSITKYSLRENFKLTEALTIDKQLFQEQAEKDGGLFLKCLPQQFSLNHRHREVRFPATYKHLLHHHLHICEENINHHITIFIGIKHSPDEILEPFVVYYEYMPKQSFCFGCTISPQDCSVQQYISDMPLEGYPQSVAERVKELAVMALPSLVPFAVKEGGFANLHSLLYHYKFNNMDRVFDLKCVSKERCWYCEDFCEHCLQHAAFGLSSPSSANPELILKFCSTHCQSLLESLESPLQLDIQLINSLTSEEQKYVPKGDQELFRIRGHLALSDKGGLIFSMSVRSTVCDTGVNYYVIYCEQQQLLKQYSEFFVTTEGNIQSFLPHIQCTAKFDIGDEFVVFDYLSTHIKFAFTCYEKFMEKEEEYKPSCVSIPVGIDFSQDLFYESNICLHRGFTRSRIETLINGMHAYRIIILLEDQELLIKHLVSATSNQLQCLQELLSGLDQCEHMLAKLYDIFLKVLVETISELTKVCEKEMKILLSSFSVLLWDSINQLPLYEHSTSWPTELIEVLLAYLNMRKEQLRSTQSLPSGIGSADVPVFHVLRNCNDQKRIPSKSQLCRFVYALKPFLHLGGGFRWATLLVLSPLAAELTDLQLIRLQMGDIVYMEKYLSNFIHPSEVLHVLQGLLLLPENRMMLNSSGLVERCLHSEDDMGKTEATKILCSLTLNKQEIDTTDSELTPDDVHGDLIERLLSTLLQYRSTMPNGDDAVASTAELLLKQFRVELEKGEVDMCRSISLVTLLASYITDLFPVICCDDFAPQWKGELWNTLFDVLGLMLPLMDDNQKQLEVAMIDALILSLSRCKHTVIKVHPCLLTGALHFMYVLVDKHHHNIPVEELVEVLQHFVTVPNILRVQTMLILSLLASEVTGSHSELLTLDKQDLKLLKSGSFPMLQVLRFVNAMCFCSKNCQLLVSEGMMEFLSMVFDETSNEAEQELAAIVVDTLLAIHTD